MSQQTLGPWRPWDYGDPGTTVKEGTYRVHQAPPPPPTRGLAVVAVVVLVVVELLDVGEINV